ncbi:MAG: sensor histidine kinase [Planctomycetota bacterium]
MQRIQELLATGEDPVRIFPSVAELVSEHCRIRGARLVLEGRVRARWGEHEAEPERFPAGPHATLEVEPAEPLDPQGRAFLDCAASALGLALDAEHAREGEHERRRRLEEILAVVCHDLRSPLGTIFLSLGLIERRRATNDGRPTRDARAIRGAAEQIDRFIEDLVELRRIENGLLVLERNRQAPATLIAEAVSTARSPVVEHRSLDLVAHVAPGLPSVLVDRERLLRTIARLLEHAARSTPRGATVDLRALPSEDGGVTFEVDAPSPHLLDEADILGASGKTPGTGFALAIASRVVRDQGGRIYASARDGRVKLGFTIPALAAEEEPVTRAA